MNNGNYGLPSLFNSPAPHALTMLTEATPGTSNSHQGGQGSGFGSLICKALAHPTASDYYLAGMTFQVAYPMGGGVYTKMGLRSDSVMGIGGGTYSTWRWYITLSTGDMTAAGNVTAYSDPRLKDGFERIADPLGILAKLDGGTFRWRQGIEHTAGKSGKRDYGVLADQVEAVMPEIVADSVEIGGERYKTVAYEKFVPVLIEAVKTLTTRLARVEGELAALRGAP